MAASSASKWRPIARKLGCEVSLIEAQPRILMRGVPEEIAQVVHARHLKSGVKMEVGTALKAVETGGVVLADDRKIEADIVHRRIGRRHPETAHRPQAELDVENGIRCSETLMTSDPDIYAAGDCCSFPHPLFGGKRLRLEAWRNATDQANVATANMLGGTKSYMAVPWFWPTNMSCHCRLPGFRRMAWRPSGGKSRNRLSSFSIAMQTDVLVVCSGIGPGNTIARDVKHAEMLNAKSAAHPQQRSPIRRSR